MNSSKKAYTYATFLHTYRLSLHHEFKEQIKVKYDLL